MAVPALVQQPEPQPDPRQDQQLRTRLTTIVQRLQKEADNRVGQRDPIEQRWLDDLRQYHGKNDPTTEKRLREGRKSRVFINQTRPKTNTLAARLFDMLFPTDDRNWGIQPTPVPELTEEARKAAADAKNSRAEAKAAKQGGDPNGAAVLEQQATALEERAAQLEDEQAEARRRCERMGDEMEDQLKACQYAARARDVIEDACKLGTGVIKGPVVDSKGRARWQRDEATGEFTMTRPSDPRPRYLRVDPWSFFPDPDARSMDECESVFERHLLNAKQVRDLANRKGFDPDAIRAVLKTEPSAGAPQYLTDLRAITDDADAIAIGRYTVWEYHGPITAEEMQDLARATGQTDLLDDEDPDPLDRPMAVVWFCEGQVLKFGIHIMDTGDQIYSVFNVERDEASLFGFGIPYLMRDSQRALNGGWRMMLDNGGISSGPQIVIRQSVCEPADGNYDLYPRKVWIRKDDAPSNVPAFETYQIQNNQAEIGNIITLARQFIDDETSTPLIAQGEQGGHITKTAQGMSILMNSANVVFRRIVKNWDDDLTAPALRRLYDWNMQFSDKDEIKGDYEVDARGTSVLLAREMQAANLMVLASQFTGHPILGPITKVAPLYRKLLQAMMLEADEIVLSDEEIEQAMATQSQSTEPSPEDKKLMGELEKLRLEYEGKTQLALLERETELMKIAAEANVDRDGKEAQARDRAEDRRLKATETAARLDSEERKLATEVGMARQTGQHAGGSI